MKKHDFSIAVQCGQAHIAMSIFGPGALPGEPCVFFASPGGGYNRAYYDLRFADHGNYSQAEHHTGEGHIFVAYDHLGVGESSTANLSTMTIETIAAANAEAVGEVKHRLRRGTLTPSLQPLPDFFSIGIGQSMGAGVTLAMQARHQVFEALGILGYSAIHAKLPKKTIAERDLAAAQYDFSRDADPQTLAFESIRDAVGDFVYPFYWEDVPTEIIDEDFTGGFPVRETAPYFGSLTIPNCAIAMMSRGYSAEDAASIEVPVFLGYGERDSSPDPKAEPGAYSRSTDITLFLVERMAHMHNFASTRATLWNRLTDWARAVSTSRSPRLE